MKNKEINVFEEWLNQRVFVDIYGRAYNLSDVPMTYMTRRKSFKLMGYDEADIGEAWNGYKDEINEL